MDRRPHADERGKAAEKGADDLRSSAESPAASRPAETTPETAKRDAQTAEAHNELTRSEHSKGRPARKGRPSNAGNDGP